MRVFTFSPEVVAELRYERYHHPHPRVQRKMEVLWLKSQELTHAAIAKLAAVSPRSVQRYLDECAAGGRARLRRLGWKGTRSELDGHQPSLEAYVVEHPPRSAREAQQAIERQTGIRRGLSPVRAFLGKKLAWPGARSERSRPRPIPRSRRPMSTTSSCPG